MPLFDPNIIPAECGTREFDCEKQGFRSCPWLARREANM
jgi:hypothetical protein